MKYYVVADVHGFYSAMVKALNDNGFFDDKEPHKLIVCGDMMDRGQEALEMQAFMVDLMEKGELIFIRGNHEDLLIEMLMNFDKHLWRIALGGSHHVSNGTWETALMLSGMTEKEALRDTDVFVNRVWASDFYQKLIRASIDYFETPNYIFVHGSIPCFTDKLPSWYREGRHYKYNPDWRNANKEDWDSARWFNGMELAVSHGIKEEGKQIVCGHWHASYGHAVYEHTCSENGPDADHTPYYGDGVIGIDARTARTGFVNCLVIED